ncbi:hypothetical protein CC86DRAFT_174195 [Ophiobolus disseminans]|uniref:Uncharacterized protein n=1 Tax=Ophiobolus disseminans TaxID=1469910 RepID=A0A6A7A8X8_9PLEO|nr:hypothetical protein CC86DRAFT_174195 [Ophiobolus disseminans]
MLCGCANRGRGPVAGGASLEGNYLFSASSRRKQEAGASAPAQISQKEAGMRSVSQGSAAP